MIFFKRELDFLKNEDILLFYRSRSVAQPGIRALGSGPRGRKFESCHSDHFFALIPRQKNMKPSGFASCTAGALHGTTCRFIRRSRAS